MQSRSACAHGSRMAASVRMAVVTRVCPIADAQSTFSSKNMLASVLVLPCVTSFESFTLQELL